MDPIPDTRRLSLGRPIPTEGYSDQPYIVRTDDGAWLCCVTTGTGHEGQGGQHVVSRRSTDCGQTWSDPVDVEPASGPEASYAVMLRTESPIPGRVYVFYNHNSDNVREVKRHDGKPAFKRVDSLGHYVFKYSDDHGRSWSERRYSIPMRLFACDRENVYGGRLCFFWNVGRPFVHDGAIYVPLSKVGRMGRGFFSQSEGALLRSPNLLTEADPEKITWETLPEGDVGLRAPAGGGPIAEEHSYCVLSDGSFHCGYRSVDGFPVESYSRDGGRTWSPPAYRRYADGRTMKHPRAANFVWRCENGKYLYWFHNHGGVFIGRSPNALDIAYEGRNPVWLCGGIEADGPDGRIVKWSQPEIGLYDDDSHIRISYPDLVEEGGRRYVTETQKRIARVHEVAAELLDGLWQSLEEPGGGPAPSAVREGLLIELPTPGSPLPREVEAPALPPFLGRDYSFLDMRTKNLRQGWSIELWVRLDTLAPGQILADTRTPWGQGFCLRTSDRGTVELLLNDGESESRWDTDPVLVPGKLHHMAVIVEGGPAIILFVVDGRLCDGGEFRDYGWGRFSPALRHANGGPHLRIAPAVRGEIRALRIYSRPLRVFEALRNARAGLSA